MGVVVHHVRVVLTVAVAAAAAVPAAGRAQMPPPNAGLPVGPRLSGQTVVRAAATGSFAVPVRLPSPMRVPVSGAPIAVRTTGRWAAVVIAHQGLSERQPDPPYGFGRVVARLGGNGSVASVPVSLDSRSRPVTYPSGIYVVYLLTDPGHRVSATLTWPGHPGRTRLTAYRRVDGGGRLATLGGPTLSGSGRHVLTEPSGVVDLGIVKAPVPTVHDVAVCLQQQSAAPPDEPVAAGDTCTLPADSTQSVSATHDVGPTTGPAAAAWGVAFPLLAAGGYRVPFHVRVSDVGPVLAFASLQWAYQEFLTVVPACRPADLALTTSALRSSYRSGGWVHVSSTARNRSRKACALPLTGRGGLPILVRGSNGSPVPGGGVPGEGYAVTDAVVLVPGRSFTETTVGWDQQVYRRGRFVRARPGRYTAAALWPLFTPDEAHVGREVVSPRVAFRIARH